MSKIQRKRVFSLLLAFTAVLALLAVLSVGTVYADEMAVSNLGTSSINLATGMSLMLQMDSTDYGYIAIQAVGADLTGTLNEVYFYPSSSPESGKMVFTSTTDTTVQVNYGNTLIQPTWNSEAITASGAQYPVAVDGQYTLTWLSPYVVAFQADTANLMTWLIIFAIMSIPAGIFVVLFRMGVLGGAIGLLIGTGLAYALFSSTVPLWLVFTVVMGNIALIYATMRRET